jgi:hypothetical protein
MPHGLRRARSRPKQFNELIQRAGKQLDPHSALCHRSGPPTPRLAGKPSRSTVAVRRPPASAAATKAVARGIERAATSGGAELLRPDTGSRGLKEWPHRAAAR